MTDTEQTKADAGAKQRTDDQKKHAEDTKKKIAAEREARSKTTKDVSEVKPTPTQEENDLAASGVYLAEHEDDGSGPDPNSPEGQAEAAQRQADAHKHKQSEAKPAQPKGGYATRASTPA